VEDTKHPYKLGLDEMSLTTLTMLLDTNFFPPASGQDLRLSKDASIMIPF